MEPWIKERFERQAEWQRKRASLSWAEKLQISVMMRETQRALRAQLKADSGDAPDLFGRAEQKPRPPC